MGSVFASILVIVPSCVLFKISTIPEVDFCSSRIAFSFLIKNHSFSFVSWEEEVLRFSLWLEGSFEVLGFVTFALDWIFFGFQTFSKDDFLCGQFSFGCPTLS